MLMKEACLSLEEGMLLWNGVVLKEFEILDEEDCVKMICFDKSDPNTLITLMIALTAQVEDLVATLKKEFLLQSIFKNVKYCLSKGKDLIDVISMIDRHDYLIEERIWRKDQKIGQLVRLHNEVRIPLYDKNKFSNYVKCVIIK